MRVEALRTARQRRVPLGYSHDLGDGVTLRSESPAVAQDGRLLLVRTREDRDGKTEPTTFEVVCEEEEVVSVGAEPVNVLEPVPDVLDPVPDELEAA